MTYENDIIDSVIADNKSASDAPEVDNTEHETPSEQEAPVDEVVDDGEDRQDEETLDNSAESEDGDEANEGDDLPKNVKKALDKNKRYIRNLREREKTLQAELDKLKAEKYEPAQIDEDGFEGTYAELIEQRAVEKAKAMMSQNHQEQQVSAIEQQQQALLAQKAETVSMEAAEFAKQSKDFAEVVSTSTQQFDSLPQETQNLFYDLDNPTLAAYALAKEGKIEQLSYISPYMAAQEIYAAQARGQRYLDQSSKKAVSNAPAPANGVKGGATNKPTEKSIVDGIMKELYS